MRASAVRCVVVARAIGVFVVVVGVVGVGGFSGCSVLSIVNDEIACESDAACPRAHVCADDGYCIIDVGGDDDDGEGEGDEGEGEGEAPPDPQGEILDLEISLVPPCRALGATALFPVVADDRPSCGFRLHNITGARIDLVDITLSGGGFVVDDPPALPHGIAPDETLLLRFSVVLADGEDLDDGVLSLVGGAGDGFFGVTAFHSGVVALIADGRCNEFAGVSDCNIAVVNGADVDVTVTSVDVVSSGGSYDVSGADFPAGVGAREPLLFKVHQTEAGPARLDVHFAEAGDVLNIDLGL